MERSKFLGKTVNIQQVPAAFDPGYFTLAVKLGKTTFAITPTQGAALTETLPGKTSSPVRNTPSIQS